jgi:hypothetical protein
MPSYFFHIRDRDELLLDPDGLELPDLASALDECARIVLTVLEEERWREKIETDRQFEVVDELGRTLLVVPFNQIEGMTLPVRRRIRERGLIGATIKREQSTVHRLSPAGSAMLSPLRPAPELLSFGTVTCH